MTDADNTRDTWDQGHEHRISELLYWHRVEVSDFKVHQSKLLSMDDVISGRNCQWDYYISSWTYLCCMSDSDQISSIRIPAWESQETWHPAHKGKKIAIMNYKFFILMLETVQISSLSILAWDSQYTWHPAHWLNTTEQGDQARGAECSSWMAPAPTIDMMKVFHLKQNMNWEREMSCWRQWSCLQFASPLCPQQSDKNHCL